MVPVVDRTRVDMSGPDRCPAIAAIADVPTNATRGRLLGTHESSAGIGSLPRRFGSLPCRSGRLLLA